MRLQLLPSPPMPSWRTGGNAWMPGVLITCPNRFWRGRKPPLPGEGTTAAELDMVVDEDWPVLSAEVAFMSQYVWRGYGYSKDSLVIQPSVTAGYKGFSLLLWGNLDTDYATVTPSMAYAFPLSRQADNEL